jgi:chorismate mutase
MCAKTMPGRGEQHSAESLTCTWAGSLSVEECTDPMDNIDDLRERINSIDDALLRLFNERAKLALEIGKMKKNLGLPVHIPSREDQIILRVQRENPGPLSPTSIMRLYQQVIQESRELEEEDVDSHARPDPSDPPA